MNLFFLAMSISIILFVILGFIDIKNNYEIEKMKIEKGIYERKEVNIEIERDKESDKFLP